MIARQENTQGLLFLLRHYVSISIHYLISEHLNHDFVLDYEPRLLCNIAAILAIQLDEI